LVSKARFPEAANNNEWARYQYYLGRINAMKLEYSLAQKHLQQALRKAPQHSAAGFKQAAQKLLVVVDLLLGDIPERSLFRLPIYRKALQPYMQLTQVVRIGDVEKFNQVVMNNVRTYEADGTRSLIVRLRQNVIKTAIKYIAKAYSRIPLADVQKKLQLTQVDDAEYVIMKAIKDGVIEATIHHEERYLEMKETADVYATSEPQHQFHSRIGFCMEISKQAMKAMRFPPQSFNDNLETAEDKREREQQELEFAKEMAEEEDDFA
jgi:26S proteasome regulatory subunit N3